MRESRPKFCPAGFFFKHFSSALSITSIQSFTGVLLNIHSEEVRDNLIVNASQRSDVSSGVRSAEFQRYGIDHGEFEQQAN